MKKRICIFLLCGVIIISLGALIRSIVDCKTWKERIAYEERHKREWLELLTNNSELLSYLEQFYEIEEEFAIRYENGELTVSGLPQSLSDPDELEKLKGFFEIFQWRTIRFSRQKEGEPKMLQIISEQMRFGKYFQKFYCTALIVYAPAGKPAGGEEFAPDWYYEMHFEC